MVGFPLPLCRMTRWRWVSIASVPCWASQPPNPAVRRVASFGAALFTPHGGSVFVIVVSFPTSAFAFLRRRGVAYLGVGLPTLLWAALLHRSLLFVVVALRAWTLGCPRCCGLPYVSIPLPSSWWRCFDVGLPYRGVRPSSSSCGSNFGVGLPTALWDALLRCSLPYCVVWDRGVVVGLAESGGWRVSDSNREERRANGDRDLRHGPFS